jgi:hypothetical protein
VRYRLSVFGKCEAIAHRFWVNGALALRGFSDTVKVEVTGNRTNGADALIRCFGDATEGMANISDQPGQEEFFGEIPDCARMGRVSSPG